MNNDIKALKSGIWYTISNFIVKSFGFISTPIFARVLTKNEFGMFSNYQTWVTFALVIVTLNLETTLMSARFEYKNILQQYVLSILALSTLSVAIWGIIANVYSDFFENMMSMDIKYINSILLYIMFIPAINLFTALERIKYNYILIAIMNIILPITSIALSIILIYIMNNNFVARVWGVNLPYMLLGFILYLIFIYKGRRIECKVWFYAVKIALPYIPHLMSMYVLGSIDKVMITKICGNDANALYSMAYSVGIIISILLTSINSAFSPWLAEKLHLKEYDQIKKFSKKYILFFFIITMGVMLVSPEILIIFGGNKYIEAKYVMIPVAMGCVCQFLYTMFVNIEQCMKKTIGMAIASMGAALLNYLLNLIFIPRIGYIAAAYTTFIGYLFLLFMHMIMVYRMKFNHVYEYNFIYKIIVLLVIYAIGIYALYHNNIIRYCAIMIYILFICIIFIKYKNVIIETAVDFRKKDKLNE